jgi:tryptophan halogenase
MSVPDSLQHKIDLFRSSGLVHEDAEDLFKNVAWLQVMLGQGVEPENYHSMANVITDDQLDKFLGDIRRVVEHKAATLSDHREYVQAHCGGA